MVEEPDGVCGVDRVGVGRVTEGRGGGDSSSTVDSTKLLSPPVGGGSGGTAQHYSSPCLHICYRQAKGCRKQERSQC